MCLRKVTYPIILFTLMYFIMSFIKANMNIKEWTYLDRIGFVLSYAFILLGHIVFRYTK